MDGLSVHKIRSDSRDGTMTPFCGNSSHNEENPVFVVKIDIIVAVHNADSTIEETVRSAMHQEIPDHLFNRRFNFLHKNSSNEEETEVSKRDDKTAIDLKGEKLQDIQMSDLHFDIAVCCYNDASTDKSLQILYTLKKEYGGSSNIWASFSSAEKEGGVSSKGGTMQTKLLVGTAPVGTSSRGAGFARNQAAKLRDIYEQRQRQMKDENQKGQSETRRQIVVKHFLCILDSDDVMHPSRVAEQTSAMLLLGYDQNRHRCDKTLMGCQFNRIPQDSTWHYSQWANSLTNDRLYLEMFRECTLVQPTWFLSKAWFEHLGGYLEAPAMETISKNRECEVCSHKQSDISIASADAHGIRNDHYTCKRKLPATTEHPEIFLNKKQKAETAPYRLIHPSEFTDPATRKEVTPNVQSPNDESAAIRFHPKTLRLAEDSRFFYAHIHAGGKLHLHRTTTPLVSYRHRSGMSQSSQTPRRLLLKLRAKAWEDLVFFGKGIGECKFHAHNNGGHGDSAFTNVDTIWTHGFAIWGAGRDGKDFLKALSPTVASRVACFVDVDRNKIEKIKCYYNPDMGRKIPIFHFSVLARRSDECRMGLSNRAFYGRIDKGGKDLSALQQKEYHFEKDTRQPKTDGVSFESSQPKKPKISSDRADAVDKEVLAIMPVVVCVAMYRTNGALESNVSSIGRKEGIDLWHIN